MRRRSAALCALAAGVVLALTSGALGVPASAADAPTAGASPSGPAAGAPTAPTTTPTTPGTTAADRDPVDLTLSTSFGNDPVAQRGTSRNASFEVLGIAPAGGSLAVTVPAQASLQSVEQDGTALSCTPAGAVTTCGLGALDGSSFVTALVAVAADAPIGTALEVTGVLTPPGGVDGNPADNSASVALKVIGNAVVKQSQSVEQVDVPLGGSAPFTVTLHNDGPDPATGARVRFTVQSNDDPRPALTGFSSDAVSQVNGGFEWNAGTIAVGASVSITVTVTATSPAVDSALSFSASYDGVGEICVNAACLSGAPIRTFVPAPTPPPAGPAGDGPVLAATGSDDGVLTVLAVGLLAGGAALTVAGRRRRTC